MPLALAKLPPEIILDNLLPLLPTADLLRLTVTSKYFASMCVDETVWKYRLLEDFNFDGAGIARQTGWKFIYSALYRPRVYIWGERVEGDSDFRCISGVPLPLQLDIPGARIIKLIAGGMSFHALDTRGNVYVWGALDGMNHAFSLDGYSQGGKVASMPLKLKMPNPIRNISCGRLHSCAIDSKNIIWTFVNWGRPFELSSPLLSQSDTELLQIECGWSFSAVLMTSGEVLVWWPFDGRLTEVIRQETQKLDNDYIGLAKATDGGIIPCHTWKAVVDPVLLPSLPPLPDFVDASEQTKEHPPKLVKIGGMNSHIVGLTNYGHVVIFRGLDHEQAMGRGWEYLPEFSEVSRLRQLPEFSEGKVKLPDTLRITHVSAQFNHFFALSTGSSSIVLRGDTSTSPSSKPEVIPELQHKDIISVELGDYHSAALASNGKLFTWGNFSRGALGLGDPLSSGLASQADLRDYYWYDEADPVVVPTEVRFDHGRKTPKDRFCFSVTAAGWHTGALVVDLEPDANEEGDELDFEYVSEGSESDANEGDDEIKPDANEGDDEIKPDANEGDDEIKFEPEATERFHGRTPWQNPPLVPQIPHGGNSLPFRIGFAGRGMNRGGRSPNV